jgi:hypothetical protein
MNLNFPENKTRVFNFELAGQCALLTACIYAGIAQHSIFLISESTMGRKSFIIFYTISSSTPA